MSTHTILYVEDEEFDVLFMRKAFERAGMGESLKVASDAQEAIRYLAGEGEFADRKRHPLPSMVFLDLNLPVTSGFEVLQWAMQESRLQTMPIVVFSSSARQDDRSRANQLGAAGFIEKPGLGTQFSKIVEHFEEQWLSADDFVRVASVPDVAASRVLGLLENAGVLAGGRTMHGRFGIWVERKHLNVAQEIIEQDSKAYGYEY